MNMDEEVITMCKRIIWCILDTDIYKN